MRDRQTVAEIATLALLLAYLVWVPLPFGSASDPAQTPLILPPLVICTIASLLLARRSALHLTRPARLWALGGGLFIVFVALQLVPLPMPLLRVLSSRSARIWESAGRVAALTGAGAPSMHPISIDPAETAVQLFRVAAYVATFLAAMFVVRTRPRRVALAVVLALMAIFEALYAVRQTTMQRYEIWGWKNTLIFNRATGTFVNPNHFAHYAAIILPMAVFLCALAWHTAAPPGVPRGRRIVMLVEKRMTLFLFGAAAALACVAAMLVAQSRGAILATTAGFSCAGALVSGRRHAAARAVLIAVTVLAVFTGVFFLLRQSTESKHLGEHDATMVQGRRAAVISAYRIWLDFPLFGSGAGTFETLAPRVQDPDDAEIIQNHAHNDYAELLATTGAIGFLLAFVPLMGGTAALGRVAFGRRAAQASWRRRAFCAAALTSIVIALAHALVDFNFYIPANPVTLAAIAGAATAVRESEP